MCTGLGARTSDVGIKDCGNDSDGDIIGAVWVGIEWEERKKGNTDRGSVDSVGRDDVSNSDMGVRGGDHA